MADNTKRSNIHAVAIRKGEEKNETEIWFEKKNKWKISKFGKDITLPT
jgi:hypothetical protein